MLTNLFSDVYQQIFEFLSLPSISSLEKVNKQFRDEVLNINRLNINETATRNMLLYSSKFSKLTHFTINDGSKLKEEDLELFWEHSLSKESFQILIFRNLEKIHQMTIPISKHNLNHIEISSLTLEKINFVLIPENNKFDESITQNKESNKTNTTPSQVNTLIFDQCKNIRPTENFDVVLPSVTHLSLQSCSCFTSADVELWSNLFKNVQYLNLCGTSVDDMGLIALDEITPQLKSLNLSLCSSISDRGIGYLFRGQSRFPDLRHLSLSGCYKLSSDSLNTIREKAPFLEGLSLARCNGMYMESPWSIISQFHLLRKLNLSYSNVSDEDISFLCQHLKCLEKLILSRCHLIRDESLLFIADQLLHLRVLNVSQSRRITPHGILRMISRFNEHGRELKQLEMKDLTGVFPGNPTIDRIYKSVSNTIIDS